MSVIGANRLELSYSTVYQSCSQLSNDSAVAFFVTFIARLVILKQMYKRWRAVGIMSGSTSFVIVIDRLLK